MNALEEEAERARRAQRALDLTCALIAQTPKLGLGEALIHIAQARRVVLDLFPGREETFNLLYYPRLARILVERFGISEDEIRIPS